MIYILRFDGLFRGVPSNNNARFRAGFMCYGWLIQRGDIVIAQGYGGVARGVNATSNNAEYLALIEGMEAYLDAGLEDEPVTICGDAKGVIDQMQGLSAVNANSIKPLYKRAQRLSQQLQKIRWVWTPRQYNRAADQLTRKAMKRIRSDQKNYDQASKFINPESDRWSKSKKLMQLFDLRVYLAPT